MIRTRSKRKKVVMLRRKCGDGDGDAERWGRKRNAETETVDS